jgi:23S rRNA (adenine2503-C2)-methyltransferase
MKVKRFDSSEGNVWKYVFEFEDAIAESVLYRYKSFSERTVICCSVQSGCPVGCTFCGTGNKFIRNLSSKEILAQIDYVLKDKKVNTNKIKKFQIMFMSMGEPFMNYNNLKNTIKELNGMYPTAQLLVSTIAPNNKFMFTDFLDLSKEINKIGLQFSIHKSTDSKRNELIPCKNKLTIPEIRDYGIQWWKETERKPYCNYCIDGKNDTREDFEELRKIFPPNVFCFTFSVVCSKDKNMKETSFRNLDRINKFKALFDEQGYNTRTFDPAGQDDIGGGCGQLWYVQDYFNKEGIK